MPPLEEDDLDADLRPTPEEELPIPNAEAMAKWWHEVAPHFEETTRYLAGQPASQDVFPAVGLAALATQPTRRRHGIGLALSIRTGGAGRVRTRALAREQKMRTAELLYQVLPVIYRANGGAT